MRDVIQINEGGAFDGYPKAVVLPPEPIIATGARITPFPLEALSSTMRSAVNAITTLADVDPLMAAQSVLYVASIAAQCHADIIAPHGGQSVLSLWFITIAGSGERKSTSDSLAMRPIIAFEKTLSEVYDREIKDYEIDQAIYKMNYDAILKNKKMDAIEKREEMQGLSKPVKPLTPCLTINEPTIESILKRAPHTHAGLGIANDEGGQFLGSYAMSKDNKKRAITTLSKFWDGSPITKWTAGEENNRTVKNKRLSLHLMMQEGIAQGLIADAENRDQGILGRMLIVKPKSRIGERFINESEGDDQSAREAAAAIDQWERDILKVLGRPLNSPENKPWEVTPSTITLSSKARNVWIDFYNRTEAKQMTGAEFSDIIPLASKSGEHALRMAGVFTVIETPDASEVSGDIMTRAVRLMEFYLAEALRLNDLLHTDAVQTDAAKAWSWITTRWRHGNKISKRDIYQNITPVAFRNMAAFAPILNYLIENGNLTPLEGAHEINGVNRKKCYSINTGTY